MVAIFEAVEENDNGGGCKQQCQEMMNLFKLRKYSKAPTFCHPRTSMGLQGSKVVFLD